jgi:GAF domain-containing protein
MGIDRKLLKWSEMRQIVVTLRELLEIESQDPRDLLNTLHNIIRIARNLFPPSPSVEHDSYPDVCCISVINPFNQQFIGSIVVKGEPLEDDNIVPDLMPFGELTTAAIQRKEVFVEDLSAYPQFQNDFTQAEQLQSVAAVAFFPSNNSRRPLAVLSLGFKARHNFNRDKLEFMRMLADEASERLQGIWLLRRYSDLSVIGQEINQELEDIDTLFEKLRTHVPRIINTDFCLMLAVLQRQTDRLEPPVKTELKASIKEPEEPVGLLDLYMLVEGQKSTVKGSPLEGACAEVIAENRSLLIADSTQKTEATGKLIDIPNTTSRDSESLIFVPLSIRGEVLGVLSVQHPEPNTYDAEDVHTLEVLSYHVSLALSNMFLFQSLDELNEAGRLLTQQLDSEQLLQSLADQIKETTKADIIAFYPYLQIERRFDLPPRTSGSLRKSEEPKPLSLRADDIASLAVQQRRAIFANNSSKLYEALGGNRNNRLGSFEKREGVISTAAVPLRAGGEAVGVLFVNFRKPQRFDAPQRLLIENLGHYAAVAIRNSRLFADQDRRRMQELKLLRLIDREISRTLDPKKVMQTILDLTIPHISREDNTPIDGAILLYNSYSRQLEAQATAGDRWMLRQNKAVGLQENKGITSWVFENKMAARVNDVQTDPRWKQIYYSVDTETRSELDVPLMDGGDVIGVINLESGKSEAFRENDETFLGTVAERAVLAIKNAQRFAQQTRLAQETSANRDIERQITGRQMMDKIFETILDGALRIMNATSGHIMLLDEQQGDLYVAAERGMPTELRDGRLSKGRGIIWWVMTNKRVANADLTDPFWRDIFHEVLTGINYELAVPIGEVDNNDSFVDAYGVINIEKRDGPGFSDDDERLLRQFAIQALDVLQRAQGDYRVEVGQAKLSALQEIDLQIIDASDDSDQVMQVIIRKAMELTKAEVGNLHIYEGDKPQITYCAYRDASGNIQTMASINDDEMGAKVAHGIVAYVAETKQSYWTKGDAQTDPYYRGLDKTHSEVAVPLLVEQGELSERIGVLNLESTALSAFNTEHVTWLESIARQAVIAIQKVRGNIRAEDSLKRFRLLSQAGQELLRISDLGRLQEAHGIILGIVQKYIPCHAAIWSYDDASEVLHCESHLGGDNDACEISYRPLRKGEGVNGRVAELLSSIIIPDVRTWQDEHVSPVLFSPTTRSIAVYPVFLMDEGEALYYGNLSLTHERPLYFKEDYTELFVGLSQQLALTVNRLRTVKARQQAEQRAKEARIMSVIGELAYALTHKIGSLLGHVPSRLGRITKALKKALVNISEVNMNLAKITEAVQQLLKQQDVLNDKVSRYRDQGKISPPTESVPVSELIALALQSFPSLPERIKIETNNTTNAAQVRVVAEQIVEILFNLIANAVEAMPEGGRIRVEARTKGSYVELMVRDEGVGIPADNLTKIFNPLFTTKKGGTGFGLWSARINALENGGDLEVASSLGQGAAFTLTLPRST